eukprot:Opistho-2@60182
MTPIYVACLVGDKDAVEMLLAAGANPSLGTAHYSGTFLGWSRGSSYIEPSPLSVALWRRHVDIARLLVNKGADVLAESVARPAFYLCPEAVELLFSGGLSLDPASWDPNVERTSNIEICKYLVTRVPGFACSSAGCDILFLSLLFIICDMVQSSRNAITSLLLEIVDAFVAAGGDANYVACHRNFRIPCRCTLLGVAVGVENLSVVSYLLRRGASPNVCVDGTNVCVNMLLFDSSMRAGRSAECLTSILSLLVKYGMTLGSVRDRCDFATIWNPIVPIETRLLPQEARALAFWGAPLDEAKQYSTDGQSFIPTLQHLCRRTVVAHGLVETAHQLLPTHLVEYISIQL